MLAVHDFGYVNSKTLLTIEIVKYSQIENMGQSMSLIGYHDSKNIISSIHKSYDRENGPTDQLTSSLSALVVQAIGQILRTYRSIPIENQEPTAIQCGDIEVIKIYHTNVYGNMSETWLQTHISILVWERDKSSDIEQKQPYGERK